MSKSHKIAWAAGFFDGEGYVYVNRVVVKKKKKKQYIQHRLRIGINHVAPEPLVAIANILGGKVNVDIYSKQQADGCNRKIRHTWYLNDDQAKQALIQLLPYLQNKITVAELGIELRNTFTTAGGGSLSEETLALRDSLKEKITHLNSLD